MARRESAGGHVKQVEHHDDVLRVDEAYLRRMSINNPDIAALTQEAQNATLSEKNMSVKQAFKLYKKAVLFSICFSSAIVMEGYDVSLCIHFWLRRGIGMA